MEKNTARSMRRRKILLREGIVSIPKEGQRGCNQIVRKLPVPVISSGARNLKSLIIQKLKISPFSRNDKFYRFRTPCNQTAV